MYWLGKGEYVEDMVQGVPRSRRKERKGGERKGSAYETEETQAREGKKRKGKAKSRREDKI